MESQVDTRGRGDASVRPGSGRLTTVPSRRARQQPSPGLQARRLALLALFEAEFGAAAAESALERLVGEREVEPAIAAHAQAIVRGVLEHQDAIDARIEREAPQIPVNELGRVERTIMRSALFEVLYSAAAPSRDAIRDAVALARIYAGDSARKLINGVLGSVSRSSPAGE